MLPLMVVKSPKCDEMVTLPAGLTPDTRVRCPFTKEEFLVQEILDNLPPMLEVLERPVGAVAAAAAAVAGGEPGLLVMEEVTPEAALKGDAETAVAAEAAPAESAFDFFGEGGTAVAESEPKASSESLFEPASPSAAVAAGAFDFAAADVEAATVDGTGATATRRLTARPRSKRKPKSAAAEIVKVALGGVAGLLIAQMILWWLPGSWARDPANLAPKLPGFLSWAAPERLRNPDGVQAESSNDETASTSETGQASAKPIVNQDDPKILNTPFALPGADDQTAGTGGEVLDPKPEDMAQDNGSPSTTDGVDPLDNISIDNPLAQLPPPDELIGVRSAPFSPARIWANRWGRPTKLKERSTPQAAST